MSKSKYTDMERFFAKVEVVADCWTWTAGKAGGGYAQFNPTTGRPVRGHRWLYEQLVGPIPEGYDLDHLCRNRACVNPSHLEPVTRAENHRRGASTAVLLARMAARPVATHCIYGHEYIEANTYIRPSTSKRQCRTCMNRNSH